MDETKPYKEILSDLIKKQMLMLGPNVALGQARRVKELTVDEEGTVTEITGDPRKVLSEVARQYMALSGQIAQMTLDAIIAKHPEIKLN